MSDQVIQCGDKLHVITRRLFADDLRRHFVGEVTAVTDDVCRVQGHAFVFNPNTNEFRRRDELRTRFFSLADGSQIVNLLPRQIDIGALRYQVVDKRLVVTDMTKFFLDINEFGAAR